MKQKTNASIFLAFLMVFAFIACNNEAKKDEPAKTDTLITTTAPARDPAMDPVKVAGHLDAVPTRRAERR